MPHSAVYTSAVSTTSVSRWLRIFIIAMFCQNFAHPHHLWTLSFDCLWLSTTRWMFRDPE
jgi:hypothetical protein